MELTKDAYTYVMQDIGMVTRPLRWTNAPG